jgi:hypothetical protein
MILDDSVMEEFRIKNDAFWNDIISQGSTTKSLPAGDLAKHDGPGNHESGSPQSVHGGEEGATLLSDIAGASKIDDSTFPPSVVLDQGVTLYHATNDPKRVKKTGLEPRTPPEIAEELEVEPSEVKGVYLTTSEVAERYLKGRYAGKGEIVSVWLPEGTRVFMDPVDQGSVFVKTKIPARGIASKSQPAGDLAKHDGPGNHESGSPQSVHGGGSGVPGDIVDELRGLDHEVSYTLDEKGEVVSRVDGEVGFVEVDTNGKSGLHTIHNHTDGSTTASIADLRWLGTISGVDRLSVVSAGGVQTIRVVDRRAMWVSAGKWSADINTRIADGFMDGKIDKKNKTKYLFDYTAEAIKSMQADGVIEVTFDPPAT